MGSILYHVKITWKWALDGVNRGYRGGKGTMQGSMAKSKMKSKQNPYEYRVVCTVAPRFHWLDETFEERSSDKHKPGTYLHITGRCLFFVQSTIFADPAKRQYLLVLCSVDAHREEGSLGRSSPIVLDFLLLYKLSERGLDLPRYCWTCLVHYLLVIPSPDIRYSIHMSERLQWSVFFPRFISSKKERWEHWRNEDTVLVWSPIL